MIPSAQRAYFTENQILAALDKSEYAELFSQLERVPLRLGEPVYEVDARINHVYFPETAVFSMLATMEDGRTVEVGPVGHEGLVGLGVALGSTTAPDRVLVHIAGTALRLKAASLKVELISGQKALSHNITRYTRMLLAMTARTSACNKLHSLEQQLARWLLTMNDYVGKELRLTHDLMALTLGVRRAGVSVAANSFRSSGVIDYRRGQLHLVDRQGLEAIACECYQVVREEYDRLYADLSKGFRLFEP
ncbi:MAG TPA: Crp/Fnr family transcriptional regulator [Pyrinomonadaceae bacterium]|nr:Crp/Fnr family transcriptional regulator [Pyrinomonadaceae bacterium]